VAVLSSEDGPSLLGVVRRLELLGDVEGFGARALAELDTLVPFDHGVFNQIDPAARQVRFDVHPTDEPVPTWSFDTYDNYLPQNPIFQDLQRTRSGTTQRLSDLVSHADLHALPLYVDILEPLGVEYQVAFSIAFRHPLILAFSLSRRRRDFTDAEVATLDLLRPHLSRTYRRLRKQAEHAMPALERTFGLTGREGEILGQLVTGATILSIAGDLNIAESTVRKHLEHIYRKLEVANRAEATALAVRRAIE
jgi:DNA-binding CsgD family transcriptional regulator